MFSIRLLVSKFLCLLKSTIVLESGNAQFEAFLCVVRVWLESNVSTGDHICFRSACLLFRTEQ